MRKKEGLCKHSKKKEREKIKSNQNPLAHSCNQKANYTCPNIFLLALGKWASVSVNGWTEMMVFWKKSFFLMAVTNTVSDAMI